LGLHRADRTLTSARRHASGDFGAIQADGQHPFYIGVLVQVFALCWAGDRWARWWPPALLTLSLTAAVDLDLLPLSAVLLQISFLRLYRTAVSIAPPTRRRRPVLPPAGPVVHCAPGISGPANDPL